MNNCLQMVQMYWQGRGGIGHTTNSPLAAFAVRSNRIRRSLPTLLGEDQCTETSKSTIRLNIIQWKFINSHSTPLRVAREAEWNWKMCPCFHFPPTRLLLRWLVRWFVSSFVDACPSAFAVRMENENGAYAATLCRRNRSQSITIHLLLLSSMSHLGAVLVSFQNG